MIERARIAALLGLLLALGACNGDGEPTTDAAPAEATETTSPPATPADPAAAPPQRKGDGRRRVFLIGIDGVSPKLVRPMMQQGRLPTMASLAREGVFGPIRSEHPLYSPRIWNSIATGKTPNEHGITAFVHKDENEVKHLYLSSDRQVPALWNILSAAGHSVGIVNWWTTYPPEVIDGVMVSDHFFPQQSDLIRNTFQDRKAITGAVVYPEDCTERATAARDDTRPIVTVRDPFEGDTGMASWINAPLLSAYYRTDAQVARTAIMVEKELSPDVMIAFLPGVDRVSHWLWGNLEPEDEYPEELRPNDAERKAGAQALFKYYEYTDQLLRRLIRPADGDDLVIVLSDHGFEAGVSLMLLTGLHDTDEAINGVLFARGPGVPVGGKPGPASVLDVTPSVLAWLGIAPAEDMKGRPLGFFETPIPDFVASHDGLEIERLAPAASGAEDDMIEHLRALGYLEGEGVDERPAGEGESAEPAGETGGE